MGSGWPKPQGKSDRCQTAPPDPVGPKKDGTLPHLTAAHHALVGGPARLAGHALLCHAPPRSLTPPMGCTGCTLTAALPQRRPE
ncbi:MAG: hypothetical protein IOD01_06565 [Rhodobacter sp.]|nr:hypothetical protein [Rhodobacter sp.]